MGKVKVSAENFQKQLAVAAVIHKHINEVEDATGGLSIIHRAITEHPDFKALVAMGDKITNYIFHLILENGVNRIYFFLLPLIVKNPPEVPREHAGRIIHQTIDWLNWYVNSDYYKNNDVYFNLVEPDGNEGENNN